MKTEFSRQPRVLPDIPEGELRIPNPPSMQSKPEFSWFAILVPPMVMLVVTVLVALSMGSMFMMISVVMTILSLITSLTNAANQISKFKKNKKKREDLYLQFIKDKRTELELARKKQASGMSQLYPDPSICFERVEHKDSKLYEKTPVFNDFLALRIGIGNMPMSLKVDYEEQAIQMESDPLMSEPERLANDFIEVKDVPVVVELQKAGLCGITGENEGRMNCLTAMLLQLTTHHGYDDVKIVVLSKEENLPYFEWLKKTFHIWDEDLNNRYLLCGKGIAHQTLSEIFSELKSRELSRGQKKLRPHYIFVVDDETLLENEMISQYIYHKHTGIGAYSIFLADTQAYLPMNCAVFLNISGKRGVLVARENNNQIPFELDLIDNKKLDRNGLILPTIELKSVSGNFEVPRSVTLTELYHFEKFNQWNILDHWNHNKTYFGMKVPIGLRSGSKDMFLDLHETGHGPHGLVAGTTGSGKSELLQSIIISIAMNFHPHDVNFVLIDYKGGGMADVFTGLPHLVGTITNLGGNQTTRALLSIKSELLRRQRIFGEYGVNNIDKYQKLYHSGKEKNMPAISHLIMIADEFAELKQDQPDFMKELVSAARVGRSLGIHLILATQKPAGIVDDQIWSNSKFKICLKVQDAADSNDVLKKPDASFIKLPGRAYMQVGNDEIYELFQSAYSGADYIEDENNQTLSNKNDKISLVSLNGKCEKIYPLIEEKTNENELPSQLEKAVEYITDRSNENNIEPLEGPWKPQLVNELPLNHIYKTNSVFNYSDKPDVINIPIGQYDNPREQIQKELTYNLEEDGNLIIYGVSGSGKSHLLTLIALSASMQYTPEDLQIYGLDLGGTSLKKMLDLPSCADIITLEEEDKIKYLMFLLNQIQSKRKKLFSQCRVNDIHEYRNSYGKLPTILIMIDNYYALSETYDMIEEELQVFIREGSRFGIQFCITATTQNIVRYKVAINFKSVITFEQNDESDYSGIVGRTEGLVPQKNKGRCLVKMEIPVEAQICQLEFEDMDFEAIAEKANQDMKKLGIDGPIQIPEMETRLAISDMNNQKNNLVIGRDYKTLSDLSLDLEQFRSLLILGDGQSIKSEMLLGWLEVLTNRNELDKYDFYGLDSKSMDLYSFISSDACVDLSDKEKAEDIIFDLKDELEDRNQQLIKARQNNEDIKDIIKGWKQICIIINGVSALTDSDNYSLISFLEKVLKEYYQSKTLIIGIDGISDLSGNYDSLVKLLKEDQTGIILGSIKEQNVFNVNVPFSFVESIDQYNDGYLVNRNKYTNGRFAFLDKTNEWI